MAINVYAFKNMDGKWYLSVLKAGAKWKGKDRPANVYDTQQDLIAEVAQRNSQGPQLTIVWEDDPTV